MKTWGEEELLRDWFLDDFRRLARRESYWARTYLRLACRIRIVVRDNVNDAVGLTVSNAISAGSKR